jgi:D-glycero-D-manno-heptose 1,7-bisphosphate phosphatase
MHSLSSRSVKAILLDRDGTIIEDLGYLADPGQIHVLPRAVEGLRLLDSAGYILVVITNQSGVARGCFDESTCKAVNEHFREILAGQGVPIAATYFCPHLPGAKVKEYDQVCECRKPGKGLFEQAARQFDIDFARSWAIGDSIRDLEPAKELGARTVLVLTGKGREQARDSRTDSIADIIAADLAEAARVICDASC